MTETECVYCAVLVESLNVLQMQLRLHFGRAMVQAVGRRLVTAETPVWSQVSPCEVCAGQSGTKTGFSVNTSDLTNISEMRHTHFTR
jgi:hypothetical protein